MPIRYYPDHPPPYSRRELAMAYVWEWLYDRVPRLAWFLQNGRIPRRLRAAPGLEQVRVDPAGRLEADREL